jgi:serine/threonine protein kinase
LTRLHLVRAIVRERKVLAALDTPCVVKLHKSLRDERRVYLQLAFLGGGTLYQHIITGGAMNEKTALYYSAELLCAIETIHEAGGKAEALPVLFLSFTFFSFLL